MLKTLCVADAEKMKLGGRPPKNKIEDRIMMTLMYWREYRTYKHIGATYGIAESNAFETIKWVEDTLTKSGKFRLRGKKALLEHNDKNDIVVFDASETPIQRPKKTKILVLRQKKAAHHQNPVSGESQVSGNILHGIRARKRPRLSGL